MSFDQAVKAFAEGFDRALHRRGIKLRTGTLTNEEIELTDRLLQNKYTGDEWNLMY